VKRLLKVLLVLVILLLLVAGGAIYGVRSWVQSDKGAARIQAELGKALGMPLEIGHATLSWGGVRLVGVKIASEGQTFLEAPAFTTEYQIMPLLHRQVVLRKMVLESPTVIWPQNAEGKWVLPTRVKAPKSTAPSAPKAPPTEKEFQLALDTLEIKDGTVTMLDAKGARFAHARNVEMKASLANAEDVSADVSAAKLDLLENGPAFEDVLLPFHYAGGKLTFPKCEGTLGGGTVKGSFSIDPKAADSPFDLQLAVDKVQLARAISHPDWKIRSGQLRAALTLHSTSREAERGTGRGEIHLTQASVDSLEPLLRLIGESCHVPELANLNLSLQDNVSTIGQMLGVPDVVSLKEASAVFQLKKKETIVEDLLVDAGDLAVRVKGKINQEGKMDLDANLSVSPKLEQKLPAFVKSSLTTTEPDGRRGIAFNITGKNDHPKTNLSQKVLGDQIPKQLTDVVTRLFPKSDDKKKDDKKKDDEKKKDKDKDKDKGMTDAEKQAKKEKKEREKKEKEDALAKGASPDANPIPAPATPATPAQTPPATGAQEPAAH
jgi:hypothetical protein